ncbi:MAG: hypothetical protein JXR76_17070 [Deltaproteobacteria bacterium]|nr:hypothetical protein [Deltaproteobacteria bacterium]
MHCKKNQLIAVTSIAATILLLALLIIGCDAPTEEEETGTDTATETGTAAWDSTAATDIQVTDTGTGVYDTATGDNSNVQTGQDDSSNIVKDTGNDTMYDTVYDTMSDTTDDTTVDTVDDRETANASTDTVLSHDTDTASESDVVDTDTFDSVATETEDPATSCSGCYIDGFCYTAGDVNPQNICEKCAPDSSADTWTVAAGESCDDGHFCNGIATCDANGTCVPGAPVSCETESTCATASCNETLDICEYKVVYGNCFIDGQCYADGDLNPQNACNVCRPYKNEQLWSFVAAGTDCGGLCLACTSEGICGRKNTCCSTKDSPFFEGYCTSAPPMYVESDCSFRRDWSRKGNGTQSSGYRGYICNNGEWVKDPKVNFGQGSFCSSCIDNEYHEEWSSYNCDIEVHTQEYSCTQAVDW